MRIVVLISFLISFVLDGFTQIPFYRNNDIPVSKGSLIASGWSGGLHAPQFSTMDLNGDAIEDLVVFDRADDKLLTFINEGTPNQSDYRYDSQYEEFFPTMQNWTLLRDYDGDGKKDIFTSTNIGIKVFKNTSSGSNLQFDLVKPVIISYQGFTSVYDSTKLFNLYVSSVDIPSISDIDGDGDLDVLTFGVLGAYIEYHKNMSIENYGHQDSLYFEMKNTCWGYFSETGVNSNKLVLNDTCSFNVYQPQVRHAGSTMLAYDSDGNDISDLLIGDVSFRNVVLAQHGGSLPISSLAITAQDTIFPSYDVPVDLELFPAMFMEDLDNDGKKDLVFSPNVETLSENTTSAHFYKNVGTSSIPSFQYVKNNFLQDESIEAGEISNVTFFDHNGDGLQDMIVSSFGFFDKTTISHESKMVLYENTGTLSNPQFTEANTDYGNFSGLSLGLALFPTFGDIDGDLDMDLILGDIDGNLHLLTNTAGVGNTASFTLTQQNLQDDSSQVIDVGQFAAPQLYDYDKDGDLDLIIGEKNGLLSYYENRGNSTSYSFHFVTDTMGGLQIKEPWDVNGTSTGYSVPHFFSYQGADYAMVGGQQGQGILFSNIDSNDPLNEFTPSDTIISKKEIGLYLSPFLIDIDNDNDLDIFAGNRRGGVVCYYGGTNTVGIKSVTKEVKLNIFPNPSSDLVTISMTQQVPNSSIRLFSTDGKIIHTQLANQINTLDVSHLSKGIYFVELATNQKRIAIKKLIVQ